MWCGVDGCYFGFWIMPAFLRLDVTIDPVKFVDGESFVVEDSDLYAAVDKHTFMKTNFVGFGASKEEARQSLYTLLEDRGLYPHLFHG